MTMLRFSKTRGKEEFYGAKPKKKFGILKKTWDVNFDNIVISRFIGMKNNSKTIIFDIFE